MTDYDLRTRKALYRVTLLEYGCGPETLRRRKLCPKCGKYVSSAMFKVNAGLCLDCAPWEDEYPSFCHHCGARLRESDACFCPVCGAKLQVGGTDGKEGATE